MLFTYRALRNNQMVTGKVDANNEADAVTHLKTNGYFPIEIKRQQIKNGTIALNFINKTNYSDIVNFTRQLAIMLNAGLTLIDAFDIIKKQIEKKPLLEVITDIDKELRAGNSFSDGLKKHPLLFSNLYISLVKSGEASGKLSEVLGQLADDLEKSQAFRGKVKGALIYPAIVIVGMFGVTFIMMTFVLPNLLKLFSDLNADLPVQTRILIGASSFFSKFWIFILLIVGGSYVGLTKYFATPAGKIQLDSFMLKIPIINNVIKKSTLVNSTRTLSILIAAGVSILEGLNIIIDTTTNVVYKKAFQNISSQVERGTSLGQSMINEEIFPPILVQMTLVGEQTGHLDETLKRVSSYFQIESEGAIKTLTALIEPVILVILGIGVTFLVMAIIAPLYSISSAIH
ncbi:MAG: type II secretion system F family protein [Patescibacteria group bacterium]